MNEQATEQESAISLNDLWDILKSCWILMLIAAILACAITFVYEKYTYDPVYTSSASVYVLRQQNDEITNPNYQASDYTLALYLVADCTELLTSNRVLNRVIENLSLDTTPELLAKQVALTNKENTRVLVISVTAESPEKAKSIVDNLVSVAQVELPEIMGIRQINKIDDGTLKQTPSNSLSKTIPLLIGLVAALLVYAVYFVIALLDDKINQPDDVERYLGLSTLGIIPNRDGTRKKKYKSDGSYYYYYKRSYGYGKYGYGKYGYGHGEHSANAAQSEGEGKGKEKKQ